MRARARAWNFQSYCPTAIFTHRTQNVKRLQHGSNYGSNYILLP